MKYVAVEGMTIAYTAELEGVPIGAAVVEATPGAASENVKVDDSGVYRDGLKLTATAWSVTANGQEYAGGGSVQGTFSSTAKKVLVDGEKILLQGDEASFSVEATNIAVPADTRTFDITAKIVSAGQTLIKAE